MAAVTHDLVLAMFESRFDVWSANEVLEEMLARAHVPTGGPYKKEALLKLADTLESARPNDRVDGIVSSLRHASAQAESGGGSQKQAPAADKVDKNDKASASPSEKSDKSDSPASSPAKK